MPITTVPTLQHRSLFVRVHACVSLMCLICRPPLQYVVSFHVLGSELLCVLWWVTAKAAAKDRIINEATFLLGRDKNLSPL